MSKLRKTFVSLLFFVALTYIVGVSFELYVLHLFEQAIPQLQHDLSIIHPAEWSA